MNPWMWLLWAIAAIVILFIASACVSVAVDGFRKRQPCARCGYDASKEVGSWKPSPSS